MRRDARRGRAWLIGKGGRVRVSIICIGNELLMDDGVGPACARYLLSRYEFPENVQVIDRACMGMAIISDLRECDFALVLDAIEVPGAVAGELFSFEPQDVAPTPAGMTSLHDVRFADVLGSAEFLGIRCAGHCFGVQAENMNPSEFIRALTPRVAAAVPLVCRLAVDYLRDILHVEVQDRLSQGLVQPVLPQVYGEPDSSVMCGHLAHLLMKASVPEVEPVEGDASKIRLGLGFSQAGCLRSVHGIEVSDQAEPGVYIIKVGPDASDLDCDALRAQVVEALQDKGL